MRNIKIILSMLLVLVLACTAAIAEADDKYAVDGEKTILIDRDDFCLYLTGDYEANDNCNGISGNFMFKLKCVIENKTSQVIDGVSYTGVINGWSLGSNYTMSASSDIQPGTKTKSAIWFTTEDTEVASFEDLESMSLTFIIKDENYKDMFTAETGTIHFHATAPVEEAAAETAPAAEEQTETMVTSAEVPAAPIEAKANETVIIYGSYETLETGSKGDAAKQLQKALIAKGFLSGSADGIYGKGTAGGVSKFQESVGLEATGIADEETQRQLFGGLDVLEALKAETWFFNGGSDTILNAVQFTDSTATISQIAYTGETGRKLNSENEYPYTLNQENITITLIDGSELVIPFAASGSKLVLGDNEYLSASAVDEGLQGYWRCRHQEYIEVFKFNCWFDEFVYLGDGQMKFEYANEGVNLRKGEYYYFGPEKGSYKLGLGSFETDMRHGGEFWFNIIDGKPTLLRYGRVFESTDKKFPGQNGYKF